MVSMMNDFISYHEKILEKTKLKYALEDFRAVRAKVPSQIGGVVGEENLNSVWGPGMYHIVLNSISNISTKFSKQNEKQNL